MPEKIAVKGEVISVKDKPDKYDPDGQGVTVKPRGSSVSYWFRWNLKRGELNKGDVVELEGEKTPRQPSGGASTMVWLHKIKVTGKTCTHAIITRVGKVYSCDGCGAKATISFKKEVTA